MLKFLDLFRKSPTAAAGAPDDSVFHRKYKSFKRLLKSNNRALEIIADLEDTVYQDKPFTYIYALSQTEALIAEIDSIAKDLSTLALGRYSELQPVVRGISEKILAELLRRRQFEETSPVLGLEQLSRDSAPDVGGKAANLGEVANRAHLPVPPGFAVTAYAYQQFLDYNELPEMIEAKLKALRIDDTERLMAVSREIQEQIMAAELPPDIERSMLQAAQGLRAKVAGELRLSVRSSATSEDSDASFAGQHSTVLNVRVENLTHAYREVVASTFNPRAIYYRRSRGYRDQDVNMSVACIAMIDAKSSGVMYTVDPNDGSPVILISSVWGLAADAVEGAVATDFFRVDKKSGKLASEQIAVKGSRLRLEAGEGLATDAVPETLQRAASLGTENIRHLVDYGRRLERHYGFPLDIEWAIDQNDELFILQARPLKGPRPHPDEEDGSPAAPEPGAENPVLLEAGQTASEGTAAGVAYVIESDHTLHHIPEGAVIVARQTSPRYVPLMGRIRAFITDVGSVTGHMASVAREFRIPTLVGTGNATTLIPHGEEVTVDATRCRVYGGRVEALISQKKAPNPMKDSPTYLTLKSVLKRIAPLNLTDPQKENFCPAGCRTLHDVIRFAHEMSMREMFRISDEVQPEKSIAVLLRAYLPMKIYVVDLGHGLKPGPAAGRAELEDVISLPFTALLKGMKHEAVDWSRDVGVSWSGLVTVMAESMIRDPVKVGRMGAPSYAVIAGHYLNFNSRLGYHFTTIDSFCGPAVNDNYITFYFKGGAADIGRRSRRALMIGKILKKLGFKVELTGDMVRGEIKKYQEAYLLERLDLLGRLLGSVRLLDMHLSDDRQVDWYVDQFFKGNYGFVPEMASP
jgi:pyruvate,water dikinase